MRTIDIKDLKGESLVNFLKYKVSAYEKSDTYKNSVDGQKYYKNQHAINNKKRTGTNQEGHLVVLNGLPNVIAKDNQYAKLVDQKISYLMSNTPVVSCEDSEEYAKALQEFLDRRFMRTWSKIGKDAMNSGLGWMFVSRDEKDLLVKKINPIQVIPIWRDDEHESLDAVIRKRIATDWNDKRNEVVSKTYIEFYSGQGVTTYEVKENSDTWLPVSTQGYFKDGDNQLNWEGGKLPFIYWRYNPEEITLLSRVKTLQDLINLILSVFGDRMLEDSRNTVLVIKGYSGEDASGVRYEINQNGVIQTEGDGAVDTLNIEINAENFETYLRILKEKLIENGRGLDAKSDKMGNSPNQLNIKSAYSDMELDANAMELEFQASFERFQEFFKMVYGYPENLVATIDFKRNVMVNEESTIQMINQSGTLLSKRTMLEHHPMVDDVDEEESRLKDELGDAPLSYENGFNFEAGVNDGDTKQKQKVLDNKAAKA